MTRRIAVYELNEVPWRVLDWYCALRPSSHFARLVHAGRGYVTTAADEGPLSPWITWPTVHRGVSNRVHGLTDLGQSTTDIDRTHPPIWRIVADRGVRVGLFGPLHSHPLPHNVERYAFYVPDTFAATPHTHPPALEVFQRFNLAMVDRNGANVTRGLPVADAMRLAVRLPGLGGRITSAVRIAAQLVDERRHPSRVVRRRTMQSVLAFDLHARLLRVHAPQLSFFFTNHVASAMHRYWPATFPDDYVHTHFDDAWIERYRHEIRFAMDEADRHIGWLMRMVERQPEAALLVVSSMGQAAVDDGHPPLLRQVFLQRPEALMAVLGIPREAWTQKRTMEPDYTFAFTQGHERRFAEALETVRIDGQGVRVRVLPDATVGCSFGQRNVDEATVRVEIEGRPCTLEHLGLCNTGKQDEADSNAYHVPEGIALMFDGEGGRPPGERRKLSTVDIAPSLLAALGIEPPSYMAHPQTL